MKKAISQAHGHIDVEAALVPCPLEGERDRLGRAAEGGGGHAVGQGDAQRADVGGEELGLHHRADRVVARQQDHQQRDQGEGHQAFWVPAMALSAG